MPLPLMPLPWEAPTPWEAGDLAFPMYPCVSLLYPSASHPYVWHALESMVEAVLLPMAPNDHVGSEGWE